MPEATISPHPHPLPQPGEGAFKTVVAADHRFQFLPTGAAALAELEKLIHHAHKSVCLEMYIFKDDATGRRIRSALIDAAKKGVDVRVLLDDFGAAELPKNFFAELTAAGGELRFFNPNRVLRVAFRNHRKLCTVDYRYAVIGGFNVGDEYNGDGVNIGWRDLGMRLEGPVVDALQATFERLFLAARADTRAVIAFARGLAPPPIEFDKPLLLASGPGFKSERVRKMLYRDMRAAHRIAIIAAYFAPTWRLRRAMRHAARHGIVRLMLPGKSDVPVMRLAAQHLYESMLSHSVEIFEYQPQILHAKLVVIDDIVYIGSANFDVRSLQLNFDFLLRIPNADLAAQARGLFANDMSHSIGITLPEWHAAVGYWGRTVRMAAYWLATRLDPYLARRRWRSLR